MKKTENFFGIYDTNSKVLQTAEAISEHENRLIMSLNRQIDDFGNRNTIDQKTIHIGKVKKEEIGNGLIKISIKISYREKITKKINFPAGRALGRKINSLSLKLF